MGATLAAIEARERDPQASASSLRYMPGLDVLRGLAIGAVMLYHGSRGAAPALPLHATFAQHLIAVLSQGFTGVHLFFLLSGFLITGILIDSRNKTSYYKDFYLRRALRILPASLLMLLVLKLTHSISGRFLAAALLYAANMPSLFKAATEYGPLWSLSVEEQFYLVWPVFVRRLSVNALACVSVAIVVLTPMLRLALQYAPASIADIHYKTWVVSDFFAAGALLAIGARTPAWIGAMSAAMPWLVVSGVLLVAVSFLLPTFTSRFAESGRQALMLEPWLVLFSGMVLAAFLHPGIAKATMAAPLLFLAKISYGLYLCHQAIFNLVDRHWVLPAGQSSELAVLSRFCMATALSIAVAALSRFTFEEFFLRLKPTSAHPFVHANVT